MSFRRCGARFDEVGVEGRRAGLVGEAGMETDVCTNAKDERTNVSVRNCARKMGGIGLFDARTIRSMWSPSVFFFSSFSAILTRCVFAAVDQVNGPKIVNPIILGTRTVFVKRTERR